MYGRYTGKQAYLSVFLLYAPIACDRGILQVPRIERVLLKVFFVPNIVTFSLRWTNSQREFESLSFTILEGKRDRYVYTWSKEDKPPLQVKDCELMRCRFFKPQNLSVRSVKYAVRWQTQERLRGLEWPPTMDGQDRGRKHGRRQAAKTCCTPCDQGQAPGNRRLRKANMETACEVYWRGESPESGRRTTHSFGT